MKLGCEMGSYFVADPKPSGGLREASASSRGDSLRGYDNLVGIPYRLFERALGPFPGALETYRAAQRR